MAVSNNDRISSRRLLDTLKGLQASRHLGSEPEVVTETVEYPAKVRPQAGTFPDTEEGLIDMLSDSTINVEHNLPIKVYGAITRNANGFTVPEKSGEPLATLDVVSDVLGATVISDIEITDEMFNNQPITGHYIMINIMGMGYGCFYETTNMTALNSLHVWETTASSEDIVTKTKHTIKQDYLPNADWNQNDPDGDGYVEGRTHWVENEEIELIASYNGGINSVASMIKPTGFKYDNGAWESEREAIRFDVDLSGAILSGYMLCEDENGDEITDVTVALSSGFYNGILVIDYTAFLSDTYMLLPSINGADTTATSVIGVGEVVHKLDKKFYDKTKNFSELSGKVTNRQIEDGAVRGYNLVDGAVSTEKLAYQCVTTDKLADSAIGSAKIASEAVTNNKIKKAAVTTDKIDFNVLIYRGAVYLVGIQGIGDVHNFDIEKIYGLGTRNGQYGLLVLESSVSCSTGEEKYITLPGITANTSIYRVRFTDNYRITNNKIPVRHIIEGTTTYCDITLDISVDANNKYRLHYTIDIPDEYKINSWDFKCGFEIDIDTYNTMFPNSPSSLL